MNLHSFFVYSELEFPKGEPSLFQSASAEKQRKKSRLKFAIFYVSGNMNVDGKQLLYVQYNLKQSIHHEDLLVASALQMHAAPF